MTSKHRCLASTLSRALGLVLDSEAMAQAQLQRALRGTPASRADSVVGLTNTWTSDLGPAIHTLYYLFLLRFHDMYF